MEVHPQKNTQQGLALARLLRWGEYGTFLAIIPGILLAILSSQFAWAASPVTLSLWLNLLRRWYGDRSTKLGSADRQQDALHRYESVLVALKRDRSEFLLDHAAQLTERDVPNFTQVLDFRLRCLDEKKQSLSDYLQESQQALQDELETVREAQKSQKQSLESCQQIIENPSLASPSDRLLSELEQRVKAAEQEWDAYEHSLMGIPFRLGQLEETIDHLEQKKSEASDQDQPPTASLNDIWSEMEPQIRDRIASIQSLINDPVDVEPQTNDEKTESTDVIDVTELERQVDIMYQKVMAQLNGWEEFQWDQGYQLQRLNDKLVSLRQSLEHTYQYVVAQNSSLDQGLLQRYWEDMDLSQLTLSLSPESLQQQLDEVHQQLKILEHDDGAPTLEDSLEISLDGVANQLEQLVQLVSVSSEEQATEDVTRLVTPLLQHLSECDEKFTQAQELSLRDLKINLDDVQTQIQKIEEHVEGFRAEHLEDLAHYNELHVKLSMIRFKAEEFQSQVAIELDQIPYLIDNNLRQRFPNLQFEKS